VSVSTFAPPTAPLADPAARSPRARGGLPLGGAAGAGLGVAVLWLSLLVLLPLAAVVAKATGAGWTGLANAFTDREARDTIFLTVGSSLGVSAVNAVMGTLVAWVLVRDQFWGKRLIEIVIDIPFALPTIVAGLVLLTLYGPHSPIHVNWYATKEGIFVALLFVTLPFVVRTVQPVLLALETDVEQAAASLGAGPMTIFRRIVMPAIAPAIASGTALAFARAMGEYGSVVLISGGLQFKTEVSSMYVYSQLQDGDLAAASATATVLLFVSLVVLAVLELLQRRAGRRG
jgi:sulfate transport system permease protein